MASSGLALSSRVHIGQLVQLPPQCRVSSKSQSRRSQVAVCSVSGENTNASSESTPSTPPPEDLASKLAAAEAEAEALRQELAARKAGDSKATGASKATGGSWKKPYVDGVGYRETIFSGPKTGGKLAKKDGGSSSWGFSEAELLQSEGGMAKLQEMYGTASDDKPIDKEEAKRLVQRRLLIGVGMSAIVAAVAYIEIPVTVAPPTKPLYVYVVPLLRLQAALSTVKEQAEYLDALGLRSQLKLATGSMASVKDNLLSATALLSGPEQAQARKFAFEVMDYLEQADYSKYFEGMGVPGPYQQTEYIKFSVQSLEVAQSKLAQFLSQIPSEPLTTAKEQFEGLSRPE